MKKYKVTYSAQAINDLRGIYAYIYYELSSPIDAKKQINRIRNAIRGLDIFPNGHPIVNFDPWYKMGMHKLPVDNYVVFYFVDDNALNVDISRIFYSGRNIEYLVNET